jgi:hypothetical protein
MDMELEDALRPVDFIETDETDAEPWQPTTENDVDWLLMRRERLIADLDKVKDAGATQVYELTAIVNRRVTAAQSKLDHIDAQIKDSLDRIAEPDSKGHKKLSLIHGTVFAKTTTHFEWPEDDALVAWAKDHTPEAIKVKESVNKAYIKTHLKETGEAPDGLIVEKRTTVQILPA